jgi:hypothetical protein
MTSLLVFHRVYRLEIQSVILVFSTPFVNLRPPSTFSLFHQPPPPPHLPCANNYSVVDPDPVGSETFSSFGSKICLK